MPDPGKNNPVLANPHQEEQPANEYRRASLQPVSPQVKAAQRAGGNISKPTDARTEKGGHDAERKDLTLWSQKPWRLRGVHLSPRVWGIFFNDASVYGGKALKSSRGSLRPPDCARLLQTAQLPRHEEIALRLHPILSSPQTCNSPPSGFLPRFLPTVQ